MASRLRRLNFLLVFFLLCLSAAAAATASTDSEASHKDHTNQEPTKPLQRPCLSAPGDPCGISQISYWYGPGALFGWVALVIGFSVEYWSLAECLPERALPELIILMAYPSLALGDVILRLGKLKSDGWGEDLGSVSAALTVVTWGSAMPGPVVFKAVFNLFVMAEEAKWRSKEWGAVWSNLRQITASTVALVLWYTAFMSTGIVVWLRLPISFYDLLCDWPESLAVITVGTSEFILNQRSAWTTAKWLYLSCIMVSGFLVTVGQDLFPPVFSASFKSTRLHTPFFIALILARIVAFTAFCLTSVFVWGWVLSFPYLYLLSAIFDIEDMQIGTALRQLLPQTRHRLGDIGQCAPLVLGFLALGYRILGRWRVRKRGYENLSSKEKV